MKRFEYALMGTIFVVFALLPAVFGQGPGMMGPGNLPSFIGFEGHEMNQNLVLPQVAVGQHYTTSLLLLVGCNGGNGDQSASVAALTQRIAALETQSSQQQHQLQYVEDLNAIQKLQARYLHSLFTQRYEKIPELFALDRADVSVEFSDSGVYRGGDSVRNLYKAFEATRNAPAFFLMHLAVDPYIEIAADGLSAKSHWLSPGVANSARNGSSWVWGPYYVDYLKENGAWKIHHSNLAPLFRNPYGFSWNDAPTHGTVNGQLSVKPDEPSTLYRPFNEVKKEPNMFRNHPELPAPYATLEAQKK